MGKKKIMKVIKNNKGIKQRLFSLHEVNSICNLLYDHYFVKKFKNSKTFVNFSSDPKDYGDFSKTFFKKYALTLCARTNRYLRKDFRRKPTPTMVGLLKKVNIIIKESNGYIKKNYIVQKTKT